MARVLRSLATDSAAGDVTHTGIVYIRTLFAAGETAPGSRFAGQAEVFVGDSAQVAIAASLLAQDLIAALSEHASSPPTDTAKSLPSSP